MVMAGVGVVSDRRPGGGVGGGVPSTSQVATDDTLSES